MYFIDLQKAFAFFDKEQDGTITVGKLGRVMRQLGLNPTEAEIQDLMDSVDEQGKNAHIWQWSPNMVS